MAQQKWLSPAFCQGFRCGHLEGKHWESTLTTEELCEQAHEAADNQTGLGYFARQEWASGYRYGFEAGGRGTSIPRAIADAPLPTTEAR